MIDALKMIVALTVISCIAALLIAVTNEKTKNVIARRKAETQLEALRKIMPSGVTITEKKASFPSANDSTIYWTGIVGNDTVYGFKFTVRGYSSMISCIVCLTSEGIIKGMEVLEQNETPGLGARIQEVLSKKTIWDGFSRQGGENEQWFTRQFNGLSVNRPILIDKTEGEWHSLDERKKKALMKRNVVTAITGSTISTRAITNGLSIKARAYLKAIKG